MVCPADSSSEGRKSLHLAISWNRFPGTVFPCFFTSRQAGGRFLTDFSLIFGGQKPPACVYSLCRESTGLAPAALQDWRVTVRTVTASTAAKAAKKIHTGTGA